MNFENVVASGDYRSAMLADKLKYLPLEILFDDPNNMCKYTSIFL
jgi:hypothetical protein